MARATTDYTSLDVMLTDLVTDRPVQLELAQFELLRQWNIQYEGRWIAVHAYTSEERRRWRLNITDDANDPERLLSLLDDFIHETYKLQTVRALPNDAITDIKKGDLPRFVLPQCLEATTLQVDARDSRKALLTPHEIAILKLYEYSPRERTPAEREALHFTVDYRAYRDKVDEILRYGAAYVASLAQEKRTAKAAQEGYEQDADTYLRRNPDAVTRAQQRLDEQAKQWGTFESF